MRLMKEEKSEIAKKVKGENLRQDILKRREFTERDLKGGETWKRPSV